MKLDRNIEGNNGRGKYALVKLRRLDAADVPRRAVYEALALLERCGILDYGNTIDSEFMVMRLKDKYAAGGLAGYAAEAARDDDEYAHEIWDMSQRAGHHHPNCKRPD